MYTYFHQTMHRTTFYSSDSDSYRVTGHLAPVNIFARPLASNFEYPRRIQSQQLLHLDCRWENNHVEQWPAFLPV